MLGYTHAGPMATRDEVLKLRPKLNVTTGKVLQITPEGFGQWCDGPCWQIESATENQMSGGPALASAAWSDLMVVRGVISTGFNVSGDEVCLSNAAMPYTAMALAPVGPGQLRGSHVPYELARYGRISVIDLDVVEFDTSDPVKPLPRAQRPQNCLRRSRPPAHGPGWGPTGRTWH